jgi:hypothetical protein
MPHSHPRTLELFAQSDLVGASIHAHWFPTMEARAAMPVSPPLPCTHPNK